MIQISDVLTSTQGNIQSSTHRGIVVDNKDPLYKCRIKAIIPGIFEVEGNDYTGLPWCTPCKDSGLGDGVSTEISVPEINSEVEISFPSGDTHLPFYTGKWFNNPVPELFKTNYPDRNGWINSKGSYFYIDRKADTVEFKHSSGFLFKLDEKGNFTIKTPGNGTLNVGSLFKLLAPDNFNIESTQTKSTGEISDFIRNMSADRAIYNGHIHTCPDGATSTPQGSQ